MELIIKYIMKRKKTVLIIFLIFFILSIIAIGGTKTNYKMTDYLPKEANATQGLDIMTDAFTESLPNLSIMMRDINIQQALEYKKRFRQVEGVEKVFWLDDIVGLKQLQTVPLSFMDPDVVHNYYKEGAGLFSLVITSGKEKIATRALYEVIGEKNHMTGEALETASAMNGASSQVVSAMFILIPILIIMLIFATDSWIEPVFFLGTIGIAIVINMGTNIFLGEVSFITSTVSPILQLAVSMDYAIFLLHSFTQKRKQYAPEEAMFYAMKESLPTVGASALTTVTGFFALVFMRFGIGADLGLNLFKGIILSFFSVMIFLPVVTLVYYKAIDKTMHRTFLPHPTGLSKALVKIRLPMLFLAIILIVPSFLGQSKVDFTYGSNIENIGSRSYVDKKEIMEVFTNQQVIAIVFPKGSTVKEVDMVKKLEEVEGVQQVIGYSTMVGLKVPENFVLEKAKEQFYKEGYGRVLLYTDLETEGKRSFQAIEKIHTIANTYYDKVYVVGQSALLNDMRKVVEEDIKRVNTFAIIGILLILIITFRSFSIPIILVLTIESAIWINLSIPYFQDKSLNFIGYLILNTVQLGATVDYAILLSHKYMEARKEMVAKEAIVYAIKNNIATIGISATILSSAGFVLYFTSSLHLVAEIGMLLGRGTVLSFIMVVAVMPALLVIFDTVIKKTTYGQKFYDMEE